MRGFVAILGILASRCVEFIVVCVVAAVLRGAPINTFDLESVHFTEQGNVDPPLAALAELNAHYRFQPGWKLARGSSHVR
jgi:hypothetical protein